MVEPKAVSLDAPDEAGTAPRPIVGFGTAVFSGAGYGLGGGSPDQLGMLIRAAIDRGVQYIDTSKDYGETEVCLGRLADVLAAHRVRICTKLVASDLSHGFNAILSRLRCERVDTLLLHNGQRRDLLNPDVVSALETAKHSGRFRLCGASTYGQLDATVALSQPWCDVVQVEYSILNPSVVRALARRKRPGQEIVVRSVLAKGLLTERRIQATHLGPAAVETLGDLAALGEAWGLTLPELAIRFALDTPDVDVVLVGLSSMAELGVALRASLRKPLEPWQREELRNFDRSDEDWVHAERWS